MKKIAVIGQGYVGLPLAVAFAKYFSVVGYDIKEKRIQELQSGTDTTKEVTVETLRSVLLNKPSLVTSSEVEKSHTGLYCSADIKDIKDANIYIITVPTTINEFKTPDLRTLKEASKLVASVIKKGDIIIYESTVYPGCTEEECIPVIEQYSQLKLNKDFFAGYSPERINPGDKINTLETIVKVTSGSTPEVAVEIDNLYKTIIKAGTHKATSIKVAEAAKVIENAQRDVNISFMNELALIFDRLEIDTNDVLEAAGTKFNFLKFKPGLVGGHCISVDPYYLTHKAIQLGYHPDVILSGRRVNDSVAEFIDSKVIKLMIKKQKTIDYSNTLILGVTYKENCPDVRNTKVVDVHKELQEYGVDVDIYDPWVNPDEVMREYRIKILNELPDKTYDTIIVAVAHEEFLTLDINKLKNDQAVVYDIKACLDRNLVDARL